MSAPVYTSRRHPQNQMVLVTTNDPYESERLFEPVSVSEMFGPTAMSTLLTDIGCESA